MWEPLVPGLTLTTRINRESITPSHVEGSILRKTYLLVSYLYRWCCIFTIRIFVLVFIYMWSKRSRRVTSYVVWHDKREQQRLERTCCYRRLHCIRRQQHGNRFDEMYDTGKAQWGNKWNKNYTPLKHTPKNAQQFVFQSFSFLQHDSKHTHTYFAATGLPKQFEFECQY